MRYGEEGVLGRSKAGKDGEKLKERDWGGVVREE